MPRPYTVVPPPEIYRNGFNLEPVKAQLYDHVQVDTCLLLLVRLGSPTRVSELVKEQFEWDIPRGTITDWHRRAYPNRYASLFVEFQHEADAQMIQNASEAILALDETAEKLRDKLDENVDKLEPKDLGNALRNVSLAAAVKTDKLQVLQGKPDHIVERRGSDEILRNLAGRGFVKVAPELVEGEVVEEGDAA